jgi:aryl-alcohol dehydrogenase-like predicted oxidoreductase
MADRIARRDFLTAGGAFAAFALTGGRLAATPVTRHRPAQAAMPTRDLGRTGQRVSIVTLGGQGALAQADNEGTAVAVIEKALDLGVNCIDTAVGYGSGASQRYIGQVMARRRNSVFLASKTSDRTSEGVCRDLDAALVALRTDHLDLWQIENVRTMREVDQITAPGGALEGFLYGKEQRQTRFLGVTGVSNPAVLMELIRRGPFDCVSMGINAADRHHLSFAAELLPLAVSRQVGIIATEVTAGGRLLSSYTPPPDAARPGGAPPLVPGPLSLQEALYYVLSLEIGTAVLDAQIVADVEEAVRLADAFAPLSDADMRAIAERTRPVARQSLYLRQGIS